MYTLSSLKERIKQNPQLKVRLHKMMFCNARPRWWVKRLLNPLCFHHGKGAVIRRRTVMNVSPINAFRLGKNSTIEEYCVVDNSVGEIIIGNDTRIGLRNTLIGSIYIGNHVILAQNVVLSALNHQYSDVSVPIHLQGFTMRPIRIEDEVWIGANSVITAGVTIGKHAVVAGGSVITKDVPPYTVVAGNPARPLKQYDPSTKEWVRIKL
jgi:acetyltransferase-like isoleucine patch superfamily enzyme